MPNWPPDPNKTPDNNDDNHLNSQSNPDPNLARQPFPSNTAGREWYLLEKTLMASIEEQRRARRWGIFFKLLTFGYIILLLLIAGRGCVSNEPQGIRGINSTVPHIAVVDVQGVISADEMANADVISDALTEAFENANAEAVALNINSPGGSPVQSDQIWQTMMDLREEYPEKKLYAIIGDIGASGAYYIAAAADEIYVNPSSLVGSIGVIMPSYNVESLMDKVGVEDRTITAGKYKDILSLSRPLTEFEEAHVKTLLDNTHQHFINAVKLGRGDRLKNPEANKIFTGLFWTGEQSIELGLADQTGSLHQLEKTLDLKAVNYTPVDPMQELLDRFSLKLGAGIGSSIAVDLLPQDVNNGQIK